MHGQDAAGNEFSVLPDAEMPRLYSHHVIKHELQVQTALHTHLRRPAESYTHTQQNHYVKHCVTQHTPA